MSSRSWRPLPLRSISCAEQRKAEGTPHAGAMRDAAANMTSSAPQSVGAQAAHAETARAGASGRERASGPLPLPWERPAAAKVRVHGAYAQGPHRKQATRLVPRLRQPCTRSQARRSNAPQVLEQQLRYLCSNRPCYCCLRDRRKHAAPESAAGAHSAPVRARVGAPAHSGAGQRDSRPETTRATMALPRASGHRRRERWAHARMHARMHARREREQGARASATTRLNTEAPSAARCPRAPAPQRGAHLPARSWPSTRSFRTAQSART